MCKEKLDPSPSMSYEIERYLIWYVDCFNKTGKRPILPDICQEYVSDMSDIATKDMVKNEIEILKKEILETVGALENKNTTSAPTEKVAQPVEEMSGNNRLTTPEKKSDTSIDNISKNNHNQTTQSNLENGQNNPEQLSLTLAVETEKTEKQENNKTNEPIENNLKNSNSHLIASNGTHYQEMSITDDTRLWGRELAQRLNSHESTIWRQLEKVRKGEKTVEEFAEWSRKQDKDNIAWVPDSLDSKKTYYKPQKLTSAELTIPSTSPVMPEGFESKRTLSNDIENITEDTRLNQSQLRKRLEVKSSGTVSAKTKSLTPDDFAKWSKSLDKQGIAWIPVPPRPNINQERQTRYYYPIF
ncbi:MAG: hypothetical protein F6K24_01955 [Okeania sp. SIO2D1]|nr:hypothetical protein [Okeania sp. SIO2D1]